MAKLSLSNVLYNRRRINFLTLLCALLLVFFLGSILIAKNPNKTKAAAGVNIRGGGRITVYSGCTTYELYNYGGNQAIKTTGCPGAGVTVLPEDANLELDGWTGAFTVTTYSDPGKPVKVNRLSILGTFNTVKLTHEALTVAEATDCDAAPKKDSSILGSDDLLNISAECKMARAKKVDIEATDNITISAGGYINVDGKGYPGASIQDDGTCNHVSFGIGRGGDCGPKIDNASGVGGSFGGLGDNTYNIGAVGVGTTYNYIASSGELEFGSGGGAIRFNAGSDFSGSDGGSGGGRVKLKANILSIAPGSYITADGDIGIVPTTWTDINITGGGGSGGVIVLDVANIDMSAVIASSANSEYYPSQSGGIPDKFIATAAGGQNRLDFRSGGADSAHYGSDGVIQIDSHSTVSGSLFQMSAQGGRACGSVKEGYIKFCSGTGNNHSSRNDGSGGGGGWIVIQSAGDVSGVSINKSLSPVSRTDGSTIFNPYALKMGDIITVTFNVVNMTVGQTYTITDEFLSTKNVLSAQSCDYVAGSDSPAMTTMAPGAKIVWNLIAATDSAQLSYKCKVGASSGIGDPVE